MSNEVVPAAPDDLRTATFNALIPLWLENLAVNLPTIRSGLDLSELPKKKEPCIVVGGGPSLNEFHHLKVIKDSGWKHPIITCDKELANVLEHSLIPYVVASVDGNPIISKFYKKPAVKQHFGASAVFLNNKSPINAVFNSYVNPETVKAWKGKTYWFNNIIDEMFTADGKPNKRGLAFALYMLTKRKSLMTTLGNVGAFCWHLAHVLECDPIILIGIDYAERVSDKKDAAYFKSMRHMYRQKHGYKVASQLAADIHQVEKNPDFNTFYLVQPVWKTYRDMLAKAIIDSKKHTIQCTGNGCLHTKAEIEENFPQFPSVEKKFFIFGERAPNFEAMPLAQCLERYK